MNQEQFKQWPVEARPQYGDRYEVPYLPSTCRFDGTTTNGLTYRGHQQPLADNQQPAGKPSRRSGPIPRQNIDLSQLADTQPRDFSTAYKTDFNRPSAVRNLSKSQAATLLRELRLRKRQRELATAAQTTGKGAGPARGGVIVA